MFFFSVFIMASQLSENNLGGNFSDQIRPFLLISVGLDRTFFSKTVHAKVVEGGQSPQ